jgi:hypothetical protein
MRFYIGLHHPADARHFQRCFISINSVRSRKRAVPSGEWILDSGAFTELARHGCYRQPAEEYAKLVNKIADRNPGLRLAVSQDWMCEPFIIEKTGLTLPLHQQLTIERYDIIREHCRVYVMPVLQGYAPADYVSHIDQYGDRLLSGMVVGVGSVCKRNSNVAEVENVLSAIKQKRPDLHLHGFGVKTTALASSLVRDRLYSADSMAWSFAARKQGRNANSWQEAKAFLQRIETMPVQCAFQV